MEDLKAKTLINVKKVKLHYSLTYGNELEYGRLEKVIRLNVYISDYKFFTYYTGYLKHGLHKRISWLLELIKHPDNFVERDNGVREIPLKILTGVSPKDYKYKEFLAAPYLVRKLFNGSNHPEYMEEIDYEN